MPKNASINAIVIAIILLCMLVVYWCDDNVTQTDTSPNDQQKSIGEDTTQNQTAPTYLHYSSNLNAFWYFFTTLGCLLLAYSVLHFGSDAITQTELRHWLLHAPAVVLSNVSNISLLIAAIAYGQGKEFKAQRALRSFGIGVLVITIWVILWELADHDHNLLYTSLLVAPDVLASDVALLLLGWVFFARWSGIGVLYFIVTIIYALLQFPARVALDLCPVLTLEQSGQVLAPCKTLLEPFLFYLLASGKILLAGGFVLMLRQSTKDLDQARLWPKVPRASPFPMSMHEIWIAVLLAIVVPLPLDWLRNLTYNFFLHGD
jgi:hypothetical protein